MVDTIITPPVTMGYCTEASTFASATTSHMLAILFAIPLLALNASDEIDGAVFSFLKKMSMISPENIMVHSAISIEYPSALVF